MNNASTSTNINNYDELVIEKEVITLFYNDFENLLSSNYEDIDFTL